MPMGLGSSNDVKRVCSLQGGLLIWLSILGELRGQAKPFAWLWTVKKGKGLTIAAALNDL